MAGPAANRTPTSDLYIEDNLPRETQRSPRNGELTRLGEILPTVLSDLVDRIASTALDYEICEQCHRASWSYVEYLIESARKDERSAIEWEEFLAGQGLSQRDLLARRDHIRVLLAPRPKGERLFLQVGA